MVIASPSHAIRQVCRQVADYLDEDAVMVSVTKGIEPGTLLRMSQVVQEQTNRPVVALTGPSHAEELALGMPTGCVAASPDQTHAELVQDAFMSDCFRVYTSPDIVGAELGGALKNVIALCAGIVDGLGMGDNTKAALMTRGLVEIARLGKAMGADENTFSGLSGMGDLMVTCGSMHSRNLRAGILIGRGETVEDTIRQVGTVEGYLAARAAWELACRHGVDMPIVEHCYRVCYEGMDPRRAVAQLLERPFGMENDSM